MSIRDRLVPNIFRRLVVADIERGGLARSAPTVTTFVLVHRGVLQLHGVSRLALIVKDREEELRDGDRRAPA